MVRRMRKLKVKIKQTYYSDIVSERETLSIPLNYTQLSISFAFNYANNTSFF